MLSCFLAASLCLPSFGQAVDNKAAVAPDDNSRPHELAGFLLRQNRSAIEAVLGKPFAEETRPSGTVASGYRLPGFKQNYLVAFYVQDKKSEMYGKIEELELTGTEPSGFTGLFGLALGDSAQKVEALLGKPDEIRHEDDVNVDLWDYKHHNYSLEFAPDRKLYSIQVVDQPGETPPGAAGHLDALRFARAIQAGDIETIMKMASGELECSSSDVFGIQSGSARQILSDRKSNISFCLERAAQAVISLEPEMKGADDEIRIWERHSPGAVTKFPASSPLKEIVFVQEAGAWRVYEVTFR